MQFLVIFKVILNALVVAGRGWSSDDSMETCTDGYFIQWISYLKRFSLVVLILSGVILYYIPESRSHAKKGCCFLIDNIADGLKTVLCLKESERAFNQKKTHYVDSFISERRSQDLFKNEIFDSGYVKHCKNVGDTVKKEERREKIKRIREKLKNEIHERSTNRSKHHRSEKHNRSMRDARESNRNNQDIPSLNFEEIEIGNEYLINDGSTNSSPIYSARNCTSYLISGSPQEMAILDDKDNVNIVVPRKLYPVKPKYDERSNRKIDDSMNNGTVGGKELQKATCSVAKIISTAETVILNHSGLKSTREVSPAEKGEKTQLTKDPENKEAKIYYERTPRLKEKMNTEFKCKEKPGKVRETGKLLPAEEVDEKDKKTTEPELLFELGDQINKLDLTIRMMRPSSRKDIKEKDGREEYALQAVETVLQDIKRGFQEYDEGAKRRRKIRTSRTMLSQENNIELVNKRKSKETVHTRYSGDENEQYIDQITVKVDDKKVRISGKNNYTKEWRKEKNDETNSDNDNEDEDEDEYEDISRDEDIPIFTNRFKPILSGAVNWLFGRCPHTEKITSDTEKNE